MHFQMAMCIRLYLILLMTYIHGLSQYQTHIEAGNIPLEDTRKQTQQGFRFERDSIRLDFKQIEQRGDITQS